MTDDDNTNAGGGLDLAAWEAPPVPDGLADAVIARMRTGVVAVDTVVTRPARSPMPRRWWIAGAVAAVAAAGTVAVVATRSGGDELRGSGFVATAKPSHVELGGASAVDLEANTDVWWLRDDERVVVMQQRGTATWKVATADKLVIDAGAAVASVEASGASLRVEVQMNLSDARSLGANALAMAAVAMVTVVVYEGHARVTGGGHTVDVKAGDTVEVRAGQRPIEPLTVGLERLESQRKALLAELAELRESQRARTDDLARLHAQLAERDAQIDALVAKAGGRPAGAPLPSTHVAPVPPGVPPRTSAANPPAPPPCDFAATVKQGDDSVSMGNHAAALVAYSAALACKADGAVLAKAFFAACNARAEAKARELFPRLPANRHNLVQRCLMNGFDPRQPAATPPLDKLSAIAIRQTLAPARDQLLACAGDQFTGTVTAKVVVAATGTVTRVEIAPADVAFASCMRDAMRGLVFPATKAGASFNYPYVFSGRCTPSVVDALEQRGDAEVANGQFAAALATYDKGIDCRPQLARKAFMAACKTPDATRAKALFARLSSNQQNTLLQVCIRNGIDPRPAPPTTTRSCQPADSVDPFDSRPVCTPSKGTLKVMSLPAAQIRIDGVATGKTTPMTLDLAEGKHKVTFVVGGDQFTFSVVIKAGQTTVLTKDLQ